MAFPEKIAEYLTYSFIKEALPDKDQKELERIEYGLALFFISIPKLIALVALAVFTNVYVNNFLIYFLVALASYTITRSYAWGMHLKGDLSCFVGGFLVLFGVTFISIFYPLPFYLLLPFWGITGIFLYLYAPADTEARPLRSVALRKKLRRKLMFSTSFLFLIALLYRNNSYGSLITLGIFWESIFTTPFMYKLFKLKGGSNQ